MEAWVGSVRKVRACRAALRRCIASRACGVQGDEYLSYWLAELGGLMGEW